MTINIIIIDPRWHGLGYIDAAVAKGYNIIPVVPFKEHPNKYGYAEKIRDLIITNLEDVESVIKAIEDSKYGGCINAVVPGNCYFTPMANQVAAHFNLKGEPVEAAWNSRLKDLGRKAYDNARVPKVKYGIIKTLKDAREAARKIGYPVVLKPSDGGGSELVTLIKNDEKLVSAMKALLALEKNSFGFKTRQVFIIEEFISGQEFSVELFIIDKKVRFASVTEKISSQLPYFVEIGHVVPTSVHKDHVDELKNAALQAVLALGFSNGPFHVEIRYSPKGSIIMETNGRAAGDMIATDLLINAFGVNIFSSFIEYLLDKPVDLSYKKNLASSIMYFTVKKSGRVASVEGVEKIGQRKNIVKHNINVKAGDIVQPAEDNNHGRLGYVISVGQTPKEAKQSAIDAIASVKVNVE